MYLNARSADLTLDTVVIIESMLCPEQKSGCEVGESTALPKCLIHGASLGPVHHPVLWASRICLQLRQHHSKKPDEKEALYKRRWQRTAGVTP